LNARVISGEYVFRATIDQFGIGVSDASEEPPREPLVDLSRERIICAVSEWNTQNVEILVLGPWAQSLGHISGEPYVGQLNSGRYRLR